MLDRGIINFTQDAGLKADEWVRATLGLESVDSNRKAPPSRTAIRKTDTI